MLNILLSAAASPAAYGIIRHLRKLGHQVHAIDANEKALPLARSIAGKASCSPMAGGDQYLPFIREQLEHADLFIPFIDEEIACLLDHGDAGLWEKCLLPGAATTRICLYKTRFQAFCQTHGLPAAPFSNTLPAVFKPDLGRGGKGVVMIHHPGELVEKQKEKGVIQDYIPGDEFTIDVLFAKDGSLIRLSVRQRDTASGVSIVGTIVDPAPFVPLVEKLARVLPFQYLVNIQIIRDSAGQCHIIEVNPRIAGSIMFSVYSGLDFIKNAIHVFTDRAVEFPEHQKKIRIIRYWNEYVQDL